MRATVTGVKIISDTAAYPLAGPSAPRLMAGGVQVLMRPDSTAGLITEAPERLEHHRQACEVVLPWQPAAFDEDTRLLLKCFDGLPAGNRRIRRPGRCAATRRRPRPV